jgi:hypothetical protein
MGGIGWGSICTPVSANSAKVGLENPLGLEDYSKDIPPQQNDNLLKFEMAQPEISYRRFLQSYFPNWQPTYEKFVEVYVRVQKGPDASCMR